MLLTIEKWIIWVYASMLRTLLAMLFVTLGIIVLAHGVGSKYALPGNEDQLVFHAILIACTVVFLVWIRYNDIAKIADEINRKLGLCERTDYSKSASGNPYRKISQGFATICDLCLDYDNQYEDLFQDKILARQFYARLVTIAAKVRDGDAAFFPGLRGLDFSRSMRFACEKIQKHLDDMTREIVHSGNNLGKTTEYAIFAETRDQLRRINQQFIEKHLKPQESFFYDESKTKTFEEYIVSHARLYDLEVLTEEERIAKMDLYFTDMTKDKALGLVAHALSGVDKHLECEVLNYLSVRYKESIHIPSQEEVGQ